jgi:prepilin peptidase CpaA
VTPAVTPALVALLLLIATIAAAAFDVRTGRIPNAVTATAALAAVAIHVAQGPIPLLVAVASLCGAFAIATAAYSAGWFGGGDVKLIAVCCGLVGFPGSVTLVLDVLVCGALLALLLAARQRRLGNLLRSTVAAMRYGEPSERMTLPYAVSIAAGSITYVVSTSVLGLRYPV